MRKVIRIVEFRIESLIVLIVSVVRGRTTRREGDGIYCEDMNWHGSFVFVLYPLLQRLLRKRQLYVDLQLHFRYTRIKHFGLERKLVY